MLSHKKIFIISICFFTVTLIFGIIAYWPLLKYIIKDQISLHHRNYVRQFYLKYPIPLDFCVYFFNVTNPLQVHEGGTPILKEIGPYCYELYKERIDVVDDEEEDSLTYTPHDIYVFNQNRSGRLNEYDYVTIIHPLITGMVNYVAYKTPHFISIVNTALGFMFKDSSTIYLTATVRDILFDGMMIDCTAKDFSTMAVCSQLKRRVPGVKAVDGDYLKYSLFGARNGTIAKRLTVLRGIKESKDLGRVIAIDNETKSDLWTTDECNEYRGTDGWIFPPLSQDEETLWIRSTDLCRNLHADFVEETTAQNISVRKYFSDFEDMSEDQCYCPTPQTCLPKGLFDMTKCINAPLYVSLPHFLRSDETLLQQVKGLQPDTEKHITKILLESTLSIPLEAKIRAQFNFPIQPLKDIDIMHNVPKIIHPVLWIELGVELNGWILRLIKSFYMTLFVIQIVKYIVLIISAVGVIYGGYFLYKNKQLRIVRAASDTVILQNKLSKQSD